ncbi:LysM peptidoglycan-binding domain-containing protein (plasmid) [Paenibacillus thiaminolyticus]|uniref:LysM peptidoglycan-binding domain-containing protein n=1 Tax=Paenibacillus thiaminolyticus TaxID=49283 RepID=UPI00232BAC50|nr:LysM peptidoglycan-binding domain-containing protein [Paenibacillus thiaminolyticus]WCF11409.1 LysM peptidoglycan-binding domain-containing protein [Paenibacillus thiaminolyticus]
MRGKQKLLLGILIVTFLGASGMFYYQNIFMKNEAERNKIQVLVAKKDIAEGAEFTLDNVGAILMDSDSILPSYITDFNDLKGKTASHDLLDSEIITKRRIDEKSDGTSLFLIEVVSKNIPQNIVPNDFIRVYLQAKENGKIYELFEKKEVASLNYKQSSSGKETTTIGSVDMLMSDEEAVLYFQAQKYGDLVFARYHDLTEDNTVKVPKFTLEVSEYLHAGMEGTEISSMKKTASHSIGSATSQGTTTKSPSSKEATNSITSRAANQNVISYVVRKADTFKSIANKFSMTVDELKALNQGAITLSVGDTIWVKKR